PPEHPARTHLDSVTRSMHSSAALTQQILDFSQRQSGHGDEARVDVNDFVMRLEPALVRLVDSEHSLEFFLSETATPVVVDPGHLRQAITSFIIRAREFGSGAKRIVLFTTLDPAGPLETDGPFVSLTVRCIPADCDSQETELRPWTGMATTRAILAQYGGMMTAAVEPASVRYSLYLPLAGDATAAQTRSAHPLAT